MSLKEIILVLRALFPLCEKLPLAILHSYMVSLRWNGTVTCALWTPHMETLCIMNANFCCFLKHGAFSCLCSRPSSFMLALSLPFLQHRHFSYSSFSALRLCVLWLSYWVDLQVQLPSLSPALAAAKVCRTSTWGPRGHTCPPSFKGEL